MSVYYKCTETRTLFLQQQEIVRKLEEHHKINTQPLIAEITHATEGGISYMAATSVYIRKNTELNTISVEMQWIHKSINSIIWKYYWERKAEDPYRIEVSINNCIIRYKIVRTPCCFSFYRRFLPTPIQSHRNRVRKQIQKAMPRKV